MLEAVLHAQVDEKGEPDPEAIDRVLREWHGVVEAAGGEIADQFITVSSGMAFTPLLLPAESLREVGRYAQLRVIRPKPEIREPPDQGEPRFEFVVPDSLPPLSDTRIAVFDGGVDLATPGFDGYVTDTDLTGGAPELATFVEHGTAVCSAALYGHLTEGEAALPPHTGVDHFRVWPVPPAERTGVDLEWMLAQITNVIERGEHKIAVVSLGPALTIDDGEPHAWTVELDRLALEYDVLFVVAGGNTGDLAPGLDRLLVPADAVNGLGVGSCTDLEGLAVRADYSSVGPGRPGARTAPTGVQFGGDLGAVPFGALRSDGLVGDFEGTSFASPVVARAAAELSLSLERGSSSNLIRTLLVHLAERVPKSESDEPGSKSRDVGYGRLPATIADSLAHDADSVTVVYEGSLRRAEMVSAPFLIPSSVFDSEPTRLFEITWTLGFFGPIDAANPVDYSSAGLSAYFRPDAHKFTLTPPEDVDAQPVPVNERVDEIMIRTRLDEGWTKSRRPKPGPKDGYAPEVLKRQRDGKWETLVRVDRSMQGRSLYEPCIDLHMLGRQGGDLAVIPDLGYALAITVRGPDGCDLYDQTRAHAPQLIPLTTTVPIIARASG